MGTEGSSLRDAKFASGLTHARVASVKEIKSQLHQVMTGDVVDSASDGKGYGLILMTNGRVAGWGTNNHGQLCTGDTTFRKEPVYLPLPWPAKAVSAGPGYSLILLRNGRLLTCGLPRLEV